MITRLEQEVVENKRRVEASERQNGELVRLLEQSRAEAQQQANQYQTMARKIEQTENAIKTISDGSSVLSYFKTCFQ